VIVGGLVRREKLERWRRASNLMIEWVTVDPSAAHASRRLAQRIRAGGVLAVVVLDGLLDHASFVPIIAAARQLNILVYFAGRAGVARVAQIIAELGNGA